MEATLEQFIAPTESSSQRKPTKEQAMEMNINIRKADERGYADHGWLKTYHTFSFANYYDPKHMGFRSLRVINDDIIGAGEGFGTHPHKNMEIITYVVEGAVEHKDNMGNGSIIRPHDVQRMSAGTGVTHSEFNPLKDTPTRLLQIWIHPEKSGIKPGYEQKTYTSEEKINQLKLVASPDGAENSVTIHQDARLYACLLEPGIEITQSLESGRSAWLQMVSGKLTLGGEELETGDGAAIEQAENISLTGVEKAEFLLFDLA